MSRRSDAKQARRRKRQAARDERWIPDAVMDDLVSTEATIAAHLEAFDERITERGWEFDDELSDEGFAAWFHAPSGAEVPEPHMETGASA